MFLHFHLPCGKPHVAQLWVCSLIPSWRLICSCLNGAKFKKLLGTINYVIAVYYEKLLLTSHINNWVYKLVHTYICTSINKTHILCHFCAIQCKTSLRINIVQLLSHFPPLECVQCMMGYNGGFVTIRSCSILLMLCGKHWVDYTANTDVNRKWPSPCATGRVGFWNIADRILGN